MINRKSDRGFTLVEVIVVAVIVAILAAVAIPIYTGYIRDSTVNMCTNTAADLAVAVSMGISAGATAINNWGASIAAGTLLTWTMPATFTAAGGGGNPAPTFRVPAGVTITTTGTGLVTGGTIVAAKSTDALIKGATANY